MEREAECTMDRGCMFWLTLCYLAFEVIWTLYLS